MSSGPSHRALRVLVAEDDPGLLRLLRSAIEAQGYAVTTIADGRAARDHLSREEVELLVTDIGMPGMGGMELIRWTRANRPEVRIVAITGLDTPELVTACLELGASRCLAKPFTMEALGRALAQVASGLRDR